MPAEPPATELVDPVPAGRVVTRDRAVRLGDVDQRGRLRLDATARYLQDVATDDASDAALHDSYGWVVRRTLIDIRRTAVLGERVELATFCSGTGRSWAERRTSITGERGASIETVSLWIRIDTQSGRPTELGDDFHRTYGPSAAGRRISSRLQLPRPARGAPRRHWALRRVDLDPLGHVNNAVHWSIVEDEMPDSSRRGVAEIEFLVPIDTDTELVTANDGSGTHSSWLLTGETVLTAARWRPTQRPDPGDDPILVTR